MTTSNVDRKELKILRHALSIKGISLDCKNTNTRDVIILDFYNIYCDFIKFSVYKVFTLKTVELCLNLIVKSFRHNKKIYIVSKPIYEYPEEKLIQFTSRHSNVSVFITEDHPENKGKNLERDDYLVLLLNLKFIEKGSVIITNDKYKNIIKIFEKIKPFIIHSFKNGIKDTKNITDEDIEENSHVSITSVKRYGFKLV